MTFLNFYLSLRTWFDLHVQIPEFKIVHEFKEEIMEKVSINYTFRIVESLLVVTHSSSVASHEVDTH